MILLNRLAVATALALLLSGCVTAERPSEEGARDALGYKIVTSLTTEVGARLAGTPKEAEARAWAMNKLRSLGFQNVREETFTFAGWERGGEHVHVVTPSNMMLVASALGRICRNTPRRPSGTGRSCRKP
jgi:carboxypeptidase Q